MMVSLLNLVCMIVYSFYNNILTLHINLYIIYNFKAFSVNIGYVGVIVKELCMINYSFYI